MRTDPLKIIGEILGEPAAQMRNPVNADYQCPFINSTCIKRGHNLTGPYPVCSVWRGTAKKKNEGLICVCPKRFYEADFLKDVVDHCWSGAPPQNPLIAHEITMKGFGNVDFVIADVDESTNSVREFISVELQAVDIAGSVEQAYTAVLNNQSALETRISYGLNWGNVRKRYISQLISKGFFHHHWRTRIVAVLQSPLYTEFRKYIQFDELDPKTSNIVFMLYDYKHAPEKGEGAQKLELDRVIGTSHNSLMTGSLYRLMPEKSAFCERILAQLDRQGESEIPLAPPPENPPG